MNRFARLLTLSVLIASFSSLGALADPPVVLDPSGRIDLISDTLELPQGVTRLPSGELGVTEFVTTTAAADGRLSEITCDGVTTVISTGYYNPAFPVCIGGTTYVIERGPNVSQYDPDGGVWEDDGGGPTLLTTGFVTPFEGVHDPDDPTKLLVTELANSPVTGNDGAVLSVGLDDGDIYTYFDDGPGGLENATGIATTPGGDVYFCDNGGRNCYRIDDETTAVPLANTNVLWSPGDVAVNAAGDVFIADDTVGIVELDPNGDVTTLVSAGASLRSLHVEGDVIYFVESAADSLWRVDLSAYDMEAFVAMIDCWAGPGLPYGECECRFNEPEGDGVVDLGDFVIFQRRFAPN